MLFQSQDTIAKARAGIATTPRKTHACDCCGADHLDADEMARTEAETGLKDECAAAALRAFPSLCVYCPDTLHFCDGCGAAMPVQDVWAWLTFHGDEYAVCDDQCASRAREAHT